MTERPKVANDKVPYILRAYLSAETATTMKIDAEKETAFKG